MEVADEQVPSLIKIKFNSCCRSNFCSNGPEQISNQRLCRLGFKVSPNTGKQTSKQIDVQEIQHKNIKQGTDARPADTRIRAIIHRRTRAPTYTCKHSGRWYYVRKFVAKKKDTLSPGSAYFICDNEVPVNKYRKMFTSSGLQWVTTSSNIIRT